MSKYVSRGLALVLFTGGLTLLGAGIANAADTTGDDGLLSGTQVVAPVAAPIDVTGNAVSVLGDALAGGAAAPSPAAIPPAPAPAPAPAAAPATTSGTDSVLGGTQAVVDATVPVTVQGNAISVVGDSAATAAPVAAAPVAEPAAAATAPTTSGSDSVAGGTQVLPDIAVPVTVGGNAISVLGDSSSEGASAGAAAPAAAPAGSTGGAATTSGSDSVAGGTQVLPDIAVPVIVGGNAISVLGDSSSEGALEGASAPSAAPAGSTGGATTTGSDSVVGGTQIAPAIALPVLVGGNAISILGDAASTGSSTPAATEGTTGGVTTTGNGGILGGTQLIPSISLPITVGDNAVSLLGDAEFVAGSTSGVGTTVVPTVPTVPAVPATPAAPVTNPLVSDTGTSNGVNGAATTGVTLTSALGTGTGLGFTLGSAGAFGSAATAALSSGTLASTGVEIAPLLGAIGFLLIIGFGLLVANRRNA